MALSFLNIEYDKKKKCISWKGLTLNNNTDFVSFINEKVKERLNDTDGSNNFRSHLQALSLTGMGRESLEAVLNAKIPEERDWAIGEALAEAFLIQNNQIIFPWNTERDKRNPNGSLPGADIVGFQPIDNGFRLAFGEVKTSGEMKYPPQVMSGRSGLGHQIDTLANNKRIIYQLLSWLLPRVKGTTFEDAYNQSVKVYLNSKCKDLTIFGVLIRDTSPNELDLKGRSEALANILTQPTSCELIALYLPFEIKDLSNILNRANS